MSLANPTGRERNKSIRRMGFLGAWLAFCKWRERRDRADQFVRLNAPDVIVEMAERLAHDAAEGVRNAVPKLTPDEHESWRMGSRTACAEKGTETTPEEFSELLDSAVEQVGAGMEARGYPMPRNPLARRELLHMIMKKQPKGQPNE